MICHVCHQDAVGQCKKCGKFYCPEHGDVECVKCREALSRTPSAEPPDLDLRLPQYGRGPVVGGGPGCYKCGQFAVGACAKCGQFYCAEHRGGTSFFDNTRGSWWQSGRVVCTDCLQGMNTAGAIGCVIAAVIGGIIFIAFLANMH